MSTGLMHPVPLFLLALFVVLAPGSAAAQDEVNDDHRGLVYRMVRISLTPGLSTNGIDATNYASKYSLNILAGYNGALERGFELGGLANINRYYARGVQIAGLGNYSGEEMQGIQIAGLANISRDELQGIQFSGLGNYASDDIQGIQFTGGLNWSGGIAQGMQISGLANVAGDDIQGLFASGIANISGNNMQGITAAGLINYAPGNMQGIIVSGGITYSDSFQGIAGGSVNIASDFQGIQAGMVNITDYGQGIQFGLVNYGRDFEGIPVGLISYYEEGRSEIDFWTNDTGFSNIGIKLGTDEIYNMISIGYNPFLENQVWQLGWSIGRYRAHRTHFVYSDFSYFKINEGGWTRELNSILKYRLLFGKELGDQLALYGGPTFNMMVTKTENSNRYAWYRLFDFGARGRDYVFWLGYAVGVDLF